MEGEISLERAGACSRERGDNLPLKISCFSRLVGGAHARRADEISLAFTQDLCFISLSTARRLTMNLSRNIVIEASAGTGKTHTLVQAILEALFQKNLPMETLVALTFTKKAAGEMKERIAAELHNTLERDASDDRKSRAREALEAIDRAAIGTIHSYAFSLLKRFPIAAGISPAAEVDDKGVRADDLFEKEWPAWLRHELQGTGPRIRDSSRLHAPGQHTPHSSGAHRLEPRASDWLNVLQTVSLGKIRELARRLCEFDVPLDRLPLQGAEENVKLRDLTQLLKPFVARFRAKILAEGHLSNDALLVLARELVAREAHVRETLKNKIRQIFVDEFQDTDPLQGELLVFLSEQLGTQAKRWDQVKLEPGKLFLVGDPKQSIYRFRGADIAAYQRITEMVLAQGGQRLSLEDSYRSHDQIIHTINTTFSSLMKEQHPISPAYQALVPRRAKESEHQDVELRLAVSGEPQTSEEALEQEAADAAAWIDSRVRRPTSDVKEARTNLSDMDLGRRTSDGLRFKDIALIFRATTAMLPFIEELRRRHIPFVVEAERYFYRTPEVTDVLNLLRVTEDPSHHLALAGFLRSPLGGFTDPELTAIKEAGWRAPPEDQHAAKTFQLINNLQRRAQREPLKSILNHVYEDTYLMELAARSYHQDQTMANLLKLKRLMESFAEEGETTLGGLLGKIDRFMENDRLEGEYPLADETYDAVRLLTVHKAKGLEFPVVWLPGLHRGKGGNRRKDNLRVHYDWATGRLGIALDKDVESLDCAALEEDAKVREAAEDLRILYVAMTRAKERLILSGGIHLKRPAKDSFLNQLASAWKLNLDELGDGLIRMGESTLTAHTITSKEAPLPAPDSTKPAWLAAIKPVELAARWQEQSETYEQAMKTLRVMSPTQWTEPASRRAGEPEKWSTRRFADSPLRRIDPARLGTLVHQFLETWDFQAEKETMPTALRRVANTSFAQEGLLLEPFPELKLGRKTSNPPEIIAVVEEAQRLLADFMRSKDYEEIKGSEILGREVPFFYDSEQDRSIGVSEYRGNDVTPVRRHADTPIRQLMRGTLDILYRLPSGQLVVGDYKTTQNVGRSAVESDPYALQAQAYTEAISRALGEKAIFKLIYLRK